MRRRPTRIFETIEAALTGVSRGPGIALAVALVVGAGDARSAVTFYTDAASWQAVAEAVVGSTEPFDTTAPNVDLANEVSPDTVTNKGRRSCLSGCFPFALERESQNKREWKD